MTLTIAPIGEAYFVHKITGKDDMRAYLASLGFVEGADVKVVSQLNGNVIINVKNTRIALDRKLSNRILVSKESKEVKA